MWSKGRERFGNRHCLSQPEAGPVVLGGYTGDHESRTSCTQLGDMGPLFCLLTFFFFMLKVVPELKSFHLDAAQGRSLSSFQHSI